MDQAGDPGKGTLMPYKDVNFLEKYFILIDPDKCSLIAVGISSIKGKCVLVETDTIKCVVVQPNKIFEAAPEELHTMFLINETRTHACTQSIIIIKLIKNEITYSAAIQYT